MIVGNSVLLAVLAFSPFAGAAPEPCSARLAAIAAVAARVPLARKLEMASEPGGPDSRAVLEAILRSLFKHPVGEVPVGPLGEVFPSGSLPPEAVSGMATRGLVEAVRRIESRERGDVEELSRQLAERDAEALRGPGAASRVGRVALAVEVIRAVAAEKSPRPMLALLHSHREDAVALAAQLEVAREAYWELFLFLVEQAHAPGAGLRVIWPDEAVHRAWRRLWGERFPGLVSFLEDPLDDAAAAAREITSRLVRRDAAPVPESAYTSLRRLTRWWDPRLPGQQAKRDLTRLLDRLSLAETLTLETAERFTRQRLSARMLEAALRFEACGADGSPLAGEMILARILPLSLSGRPDLAGLLPYACARLGIDPAGLGDPVVLSAALGERALDELVAQARPWAITARARTELPEAFRAIMARSSTRAPRAIAAGPGEAEYVAAVARAVRGLWTEAAPAPAPLPPGPALPPPGVAPRPLQPSGPGIPGMDPRMPPPPGRRPAPAPTWPYIDEPLPQWPQARDWRSGTARRFYSMAELVSRLNAYLDREASTDPEEVKAADAPVADASWEEPPATEVAAPPGVADHAVAPPSFAREYRWLGRVFAGLAAKASKLPAGYPGKSILSPEECWLRAFLDAEHLIEASVMAEASHRGIELSDEQAEAEALRVVLFFLRKHPEMRVLVTAHHAHHPVLRELWLKLFLRLLQGSVRVPADLLVVGAGPTAMNLPQAPPGSSDTDPYVTAAKHEQWRRWLDWLWRLVPARWRGQTSPPPTQTRYWDDPYRGDPYGAPYRTGPGLRAPSARTLAVLTASALVAGGVLYYYLWHSPTVEAPVAMPVEVVPAAPFPSGKGVSFTP